MNSTKPDECVFVLGVPSSKEAFFNDQKSKKKDFVINCCNSWTKYQYEIASEVEDLSNLARELGAVFVRDCTFDQFERIMGCQSYKAIILISHWKEDHIEFFDRMVAIDSVVDAIPDEFRGILDCCICHPITFARMIEIRKPNCLTRFTSTKSTPAYWMRFYGLLLRMIQIEEMSYLTALEKCLIIFVNLFSPKHDTGIRKTA